MRRPPGPPMLWRLLLWLLVRGEGAEFVLGDVEEDYRAVLRRDGPRAAARWYGRQVRGTAWAWIRRRFVGVGATGNGPARDEDRRGVVMETTLADVRYAIRGLLKRPAFTALVVITLALGIGATTAIFSVVDAVMLRALPYPHPKRLVDLAEVVGADRSTRILTSPATFRSWKEGTRSFDRMALTAPYQSLSLTGQGNALRLRADFVSSEYFGILGARFTLGQGFSPEDDTSPGDHPVVVLSRGLWERVFGADPGIVGRSITLNATPYNVVGVLAASFRDIYSGPVPTDVFVPASMIVQLSGPQAWELHSARGFQVVARLAEGRTMDQARPEIEGVMEQLRKEDPTALGNTGVLLTPLRDQLLGNLDAPLLALLIGAAFLLLVGCVNVAGLMLVHGAARAREVAVRVALGASRGRLVRQLTTEALVLAFVGGVGGILLASVSLGSLLGLSGNNLPAWVHVRLDPTVLGTSLLLTLVTGIAFGLVPSLRTARTDLRSSLTRGSARSGRASSHRTRDALVVVEVTSAMILMVGAGLLIRSFQELSATDMGFRTARILTASIDLPTLGYESAEAIRSFDERLLAGLRPRPGVQFADVWGPGMPGQARAYMAVVPEGREVHSQLDADLTRVHCVSPRALQDMGLRVVEGRTLTDGDRVESRRVAVISEGLAHKLFPDQDPLGKTLNNYIPVGVDPSNYPPREIVGVVANAKLGGRRPPGSFGLDSDMYLPVAQGAATTMRRLEVLIGTTGDPLALTPTLRAAVKAIDPDVPVFSPRSMDGIVGQGLVVSRFVAVLLGIFGALSLFLSALGIYGILSQTVAARAREVGLRLALGAQRGDTARLFLGHGLRLTLVGIGAGLAIALTLTRFLSSLLYGVAPDDLPTVVMSTVLLVVVALLAAYLPVRRALRVDPMIVLKSE